ncbi:MAG: PIN/TRAM domain-containing protein [Fuerstiella sp.]|nr:PIN/TRAM domain-containing protein [Fuerstiella sp.]
MILIILRAAYFLVCAGAIAGYVFPVHLGDPSTETRPTVILQHPVWAFVVLLAISQLATVADTVVRRKRIDLISATYFGLLIGILLAYLSGQAITLLVPPSSPFNGVIVLLLVLTLPYICVSLLLQTRDDFRFIIPFVEFVKDIKGGRPLVVDSSSLIDGRIHDVVETQIFESQMIVPDFILAEVQDIADSSDKNRRVRGRRGLEVLANLQQSSYVEVRIHETPKAELRSLSVDQKLVEVAKQLRAGIITNDFNLNKVASVQDIVVINLNDVANALKPQFLPGERLLILINREGDSVGQGVGYLDDGTMVVCEGASSMIGKEISTVVTRVLQSSAGRMIFCKPVHTPRKGE